MLLEGGGVDYTASNGSDIVLTAAASADDVLTFETLNEVQLVSSTSTTPTFKTSATLLNETHEDTDGGRESTLIFQGEQSGGELSTLAEIEASHDGTADDEKGDLIFRTNDGNDGTSPTERLRIDSAGAVTFTSDDTSDQFVIQNNDAGSGSAPDMVLYRNSASPADGDTIGRIDYRGEDDGGTARDYVTLYSKISDASTGTPAGSFHIQTRNGTNQTDRLLVDGSGNVGINESAPSGILHVKGTSAAHGKVVVEAGGSGGSANNNFIEFNKHDGTKLAEIEVGESVTNGGDIIFKTTPSGGSVTNRIRLRHDGGICFGTDNATANALDDYEEGTFNFEMVGYHGSPTPKVQIPAHYTKIGNTVHFWSEKISINSTGYSGNMWFTGLPFSAPAPYAVGSVYMSYLATYAGYGPFTFISGTIVYGLVHQSNASSWSAIMHNAVSANGEVYLTGTYKV